MKSTILPLLLESATDNKRREIVRNILNACEPGERKFLVDNPVYLGIRAEAYLADAAPEWFAVNEPFSPADRIVLAGIVADALPDSRAVG
jgi:hypothetical protein